MKDKNYNLFAYILGCTAFIGAVQYPRIPLLWWLIIGLCSGLLIVYSNKKQHENKLLFLGIDVLNLLLLGILVRILPDYLGLYLNLIILITLLILLFIKEKIYWRYTN